MPSGLTLPNRDRSVQATRHPGQLESAASAGLRDRWNRPGDQGQPADGAREERFSAAASTLNRLQPPPKTASSAPSAVLRRVRGAMAMGKGAFEKPTLSPAIVLRALRAADSHSPINERSKPLPWSLIRRCFGFRSAGRSKLERSCQCQALQARTCTAVRHLNLLNLRLSIDARHPGCAACDVKTPSRQAPRPAMRVSRVPEPEPR